MKLSHTCISFFDRLPLFIVKIKSLLGPDGAMSYLKLNQRNTSKQCIEGPPKGSTQRLVKFCHSQKKSVRLPLIGSGQQLTSPVFVPLIPRD